MFCSFNTLVSVPGPFSFPLYLFLFSLCLRVMSSVCAFGSKGTGADCSVLISSPVFPTHSELLYN